MIELVWPLVVEEYGANPMHDGQQLASAVLNDRPIIGVETKEESETGSLAVICIRFHNSVSWTRKTSYILSLGHDLHV